MESVDMIRMTPARCGCCKARKDGIMGAGTLMICDWCTYKALAYLVYNDLADFNPLAVMLGFEPGAARREYGDFRVTLIWGWTDSETHYIKFPLTGRYSYASLTAG
jgi:hypothetical protein